LSDNPFQVELKLRQNRFKVKKNFFLLLWILYVKIGQYNFTGFFSYFYFKILEMMDSNKHYLLFYDVVEGYVEKRVPFRNAHLTYANKAVESGELILGGALANPVDGAILLFKGTSPAVAEKFAEADPYVQNGLVKKWHVREWTTVVGKDAANSLFP
jgi:hypothetical protein